LFGTRQYQIPDMSHCAYTLVLLALSSVGAQIFSCKDDGRLPETNDGRQNAPEGCSTCVEWWFFTAFAPRSDAGVALSYDPAGKGLVTMVYLNASHPTSARVVDFDTRFDTASSVTANASVSLGSDGRTGVEVINATHYTIRGSLPMHNLSWDLKFVQAVDAAREDADVLSIVKLDWIAYMPSARVSGWLHYQGQAYDFADATGYHDHNSGKWPKMGGETVQATTAGGPSLSFDYKWGQVGNGVDVGAVYGGYLLPGRLDSMSVDYIFVRAHGHRIKFGTLCGHRLSLTPLAFESRPGGHREASAVQLRAVSDEWKLEWVHRKVTSAINSGGKGLGLVVWEQLSIHNLTLTPVSASEATLPYASLSNAWGFTEWSNPA